MTVLLNDRREIKKLTLPSYPDAEIEMYDRLLFSQVGELDKCTTDADRGIEILRFLIKTWSFVDKDGKVLEVNKENLGKLPVSDVMTLLDVAGESFRFLETQKRKNLKK